jgi:acetoin utilization deacetylase AcuC-like enzyme
MTLLYDDPCFLNHETGPEIERSERLRAISHRLQHTGLAAICKRPQWQPVSRRRLTRIHSSAYIDSVMAVAKSGGGHVEQETTVSPASEDVARLAAGCVCDAVERLVRGEDTQALCLVRPPGHHAMFTHAMGFCIYNNVAIAAKVATDELDLNRVLIVDWDIHHGNGTQAVFWEDPQIGFLSIHRWPFYPGTGRADETGGGPGEGTTVNLPIEHGTPRAEYLEVFRDALGSFAAKIRPELVLISAGFDAHRHDPIGDLGLETEDFIPLTNAVLDVADTYAGGRVVSVLEGGYDPPILADCVEVHLREMLRRTSVNP